MHPVLLKLLYAVTTTLWTIAFVTLLIGAYTTGERAITLYGLSIFVATAGSVCSMWMLMEAITRRTANQLREELADAVALALREHLEGTEERRIHVVRH